MDNRSERTSTPRLDRARLPVDPTGARRRCRDARPDWGGS